MKKTVKILVERHEKRWTTDGLFYTRHMPLLVVEILVMAFVRMGVGVGCSSSPSRRMCLNLDRKFCERMRWLESGFVVYVTIFYTAVYRQKRISIDGKTWCHSRTAKHLTGWVGTLFCVYAE
ncbi:hypothetical protein QTP88_005691 [Uroleucon formosanum]